MDFGYSGNPKKVLGAIASTGNLKFCCPFSNSISDFAYSGKPKGEPLSDEFIQTQSMMMSDDATHIIQNRMGTYQLCLYLVL